MSKISRVISVSLLMGAAALAFNLGEVYADEMHFADGDWKMNPHVNKNWYKDAGQNVADAFAKADIQKMHMLAMQGYAAYNYIVRATTWWKEITPNFDLINEVVDYKVWQDAKKRQVKMDDSIGELQAAIRYIGAGEILECENSETPEEEKPEICGAGDAGLMKSDVAFATLQNVGIEAIDSKPKTVEQIQAADTAVSMGFSGQASDAPQPDYSSMMGGSGGSVCTAEMLASYGITQAECESMYGSLGGSGGSGGGTTSTPSVTTTLTQAQKDMIIKRREAHLQLTGTAGVARADLGASLVRSAKKDLEDLQGLMESGSGTVVSNATILAVMDLILSQHLNNFNMIYGQQTANEAAMALQYVPLD